MNNQGNVNNNGQFPGLQPVNPTPVNNINSSPQMPSQAPVMPNPVPPNQGVAANNNMGNISLGTVDNTPPPTIGVPEATNNLANAVDDNRFLNQTTTYTETAIDNQNAVDNNNQANNNLQAPTYVNDPQVTENIQNQTKKTIPITKELKTVIFIALILLLFIIFMPAVFDLLNNARFR